MDILEDKEILEKLKNIAKSFQLSNLILFGSRAKGNFTKNSDYDFAYFSLSKLTAIQKIDLFDKIMEIIKSEKLDLIDLSINTDVKLRFEIFQNGISIYEIEGYEFSELKGRAYIDYIDFQRFEKNRLDLLTKRVESL